MKILFVSASYLPVTNGVTYHMLSTAKELRKMGHKVYILAPSFPGYKDKDKFVIRYPSLPNPFVKSVPVGIPIVTLNKLKKLKLDVIHTHHPLIVGQFAAQTAEKLGVPLFFTAHTQYEQYLNYYFPQGYRITSRFIVKDLQNLARKCKAVICPSISTESRLKKIGIQNTLVINNGIEDEFLKEPNKKKVGELTLVFTGRIEKEKDPFFLLKVAIELKKSLPNFRLIIIGNGRLIENLSQKIIKNHLENNIILTGEVNRSLLVDIYKSTHIFITASTSEVMPLSILEAMGSGLPVIALKNSNLEELIIDQKTGYLLKRNPKEISERIKNIFDHPKKFYTLSLNSYKHALNFSSLKTAKKLANTYLKFTSQAF